MPGNNETNVTAVTSMSATWGEVYLGVDEYSSVLDGEATCLSVTDRIGPTPGQAIFRKLPGMVPGETAGPVTLTKGDGIGALKWQAGKRVSVKTADGKLIFVGSIQIRNDSGAADEVVWTALDARLLLAHLHIRGAVVYENDSGLSTPKAQLAPRFVCRTNPEGLWNCVGLSYQGNIVPVFAPHAAIGLNYESPDWDAASIPLEEGKLAPWTPRRFLHYLRFIATLPNTTIYGTGDSWRSLSSNAMLEWLAESIDAMRGVDPADGATDLPDPLDRKMPDMTFRGEKILGAIQKTLDVAGTHAMRLDYIDHDGSSNPEHGRLVFVPVGWSGLASGEGNDITLQRSGSVTDIRTAYDFSLSEDTSRVCEAVMVEGDVVRMETEVSYDPDDWANSTLKPAWSNANEYDTSKGESATWNEERMFLDCIAGQGYGDTYYAKYPNRQGGDGSASHTNVADGLGDRPYAPSYSAEAVALARQFWPRVFRAWRIDSDKLSSVLDGYLGSFADRTKYAKLKKTNRPIYPEQLAFFVREMTSGQKVANWLRTAYPIRVQTKGSTEDNYQTASYGVAVRVGGDGLIWFDNLAEAADNRVECVYERSLLAKAPTPGDPAVKLKKLKVNLAFPLDHRVFGYATSAKPSVFSPQFGGSTSGLPCAYKDSPGAYRESIQKWSKPSGDRNYFGGADGSELIEEDGTGLYRYLPPGSERKNAEYAASRILASARIPDRKSSWRLIGIRPEWRAGMFVGKILTGNTTADPDYVINAPIEQVTYIFHGNRQETVIGGLATVGGI